MAKQGCEKLGLEAFDALVRRARTCRRFDESMRVPREFLLELAELAHLAPCGANAQRLRFHVVSGSEDCARVFDELAWAGALKDFTPHAIDAMGLDNDKYELKLIMAFGVPAETQVIDAIDSNPDGSINYWRDEAQVHHVPKRPLADVLL